MNDNFREKLADALCEMKKSDWMKSGQAEICSIICSHFDLHDLAKHLISFLTKYIGAFGGTIYEANRQEVATRQEIASFGEYAKKIDLAHALEGHVAVVSDGVSDGFCQFLTFVPLQIEQEKIAILEFASLDTLDKTKLHFLMSQMKPIAMALHSCQKISKMKSMLEESKQLQEKLKLASNFKTDFLTNMSHELRTPLNSLLLLSQQLAENEEGNLTYDQIEAANVIHRTGQDLLTLIDDILDLSKVERGMLQIHPEPVLIRSIVENLQRQFLPIAHDKELQFIASVSDETPLTILTDGKRLEQILRNFLSNAFKFTQKGSVLLKIYRPPNEERRLAFSVIDTGIGVSKEKQELIFEAFHQGDEATNRTYGGTGLGLSISRDLAKLLEAEIELESEQGKGSSFTIYLPCEVRTQESPSPISALERAFTQIEQQWRPLKRVLVVAPSIEEQIGLVTLCNKKKIEALFVSSVQNAIDAMAEEAFDCIIIDKRQSDEIYLDFLQSLNETGFISKELGTLCLFFHRKQNAPLPRLWGAKILLVDDDMRNTFQLYSALKKKGLKIVHANSAKAALVKLELEPDIKVAIVNGCEAIKVLRQEKHYANLAIIAKILPEEKNIAIELGANDLLTKPVDMDTLINSIKTWLSHSQTLSRKGESLYEVGMVN